MGGLFRGTTIMASGTLLTGKQEAKPLKDGIGSAKA